MAFVNRMISSLEDLLRDDVRKLAAVEWQLKFCIPDWTTPVGDNQLKAALQMYLDDICSHLQQLEGFLEEANLDPVHVPGRTVLAFIDDTCEKLKACTDTRVRDACLLASLHEINLQKVSMYSTAAAYATILGLQKYATCFEEAERNEKKINERFAHLAAMEINSKANAASVRSRRMVKKERNGYFRY